MKINKLITNVNRYIGRNGSKIKFIVIHYVGATGSAEDNCKYFKDVNRNASAHYFVGHEGEIWQCVEDKDTAWHCGGELQGSQGHKYYRMCINSNSIGIEMCVNKEGGDWAYNEQTLEATAELVKELMNKYDVEAEHVIRHFDVTGKSCPANYLDADSWSKLYTRLTKSADKPAPAPKPSVDKISEDGYWGIETTKLAQKVFGTEVDGVVSNQYKMYQSKNRGLQSDTWQWMDTPSTAGSQLIKEIQRWVGASVNGYGGPETFSKMQRKLGTHQDGIVSAPSQMVKAFQKYLNKQ